MAIFDPSPIIQIYQSTGIPQWISYVANWIISSNFFQQFGLLVMFIWEALPTIIAPVPLVLFMIPLIYAGINPLDILLVGIGGSIIGNLVFYFMAKYSILKLAKRESEEIDDSHFLHRHRIWMFIAAPLFFVTGDAIMLYAGAKQMPIHKFVIPMFIGNAIRIVINLLIAMGVFAWFPRILS